MRRARSLGAVALVVLAAAACGKKGNPLPPLRPVPQRVADAAAERRASEVTLRFTVPAANLDGTTPVAIDHVDVFGWLGPAGVAPPAAGVIAADRGNLRATVKVERPPAADAPIRATDTPVPGARATVVDRLENIDLGRFAAIAYVLVPVAGAGRGRPGPPSPALVVPLSALPAAPADVALAASETEVRVSWKPAAAGQTFRVSRATPSGLEIAGGLLTPTPIAATDLGVPVEFGREVCVIVQALAANGAVTLEGGRSQPACLTPVDTYPPRAPTGLQAVQEGAVVAVLWTAVTAPDLAGYIVLRGTGAGDDLRPLMRAPIAETTYRDTTAQAGTTYVYAVYAQDSATPPNISQLSNRQSVTVR